MTRKIKILYVEDDIEWQEIVTEALTASKSNNYIIDIVSSYEEAIKKLTRSTYHIAILDKRLKENDPKNEDGLKIAPFVATLNEGTQIIIFTAYGEIKDTRMAFRKRNQVEVWDFIAKDMPNKLFELKESVKEAVEIALLEFKRPSRILDFIDKVDALDYFVSKFPKKIGLGSYAQDLNLFAKLVFAEIRPLLQDKKEAKIITLKNIEIIQYRYWSKILETPIAVWFGENVEMKSILQTIEDDKNLFSQLGISNKIDEFFDDRFPEFGCAVFELKDVGFEEFASRLEFRS